MTNSKIVSSHILMSLILMTMLVVTTGCGQAIDSFSYIRNQKPSSLNLTGDSSTQGGSAVTAQSNSHALSQQSLNGTTVRTQSSSTSFKMVSGVGVQ